MHRFFVEDDQITENEILILGDDIKHINQVIRLKLGEKIIICDRQGIEYCCIIDFIDNNSVKTAILSQEMSKKELGTKVYLFQGVPKLDKMEMIIQKSIELGVHEIVPVMMTRSIAKINNQNKDKKMNRWLKIATSAAKQSHRAIIPVIKRPMSFNEAVDYASSQLDKIIVPYEDAEGMKHSKDVLYSIGKGNSIGVFIGPEGGFDQIEINKLKTVGSETVSLGRRILRTETASLAVLSIIMFNIEED